MPDTQQKDISTQFTHHSTAQHNSYLKFFLVEYYFQRLFRSSLWLNDDMSMTFQYIEFIEKLTSLQKYVSVSHAEPKNHFIRKLNWT